ncbi:hypothetical protein G6F43_013852 [Rhizopus delemar]|nr:hypothetical protein G6F43_013852 [Rhizopus delemar]
MPKKISNDKREAVKSGIRSGRTTMDISRTTGVSKWTINRIRKEEKNIKARNRGGRPVDTVLANGRSEGFLER